MHMLGYMHPPVSSVAHIIKRNQEAWVASTAREQEAAEVDAAEDELIPNASAVADSQATEPEEGGEDAEATQPIPSLVPEKDDLSEDDKVDYDPSTEDEDEDEDEDADYTDHTDANGSDNSQQSKATPSAKRQKQKVTHTHEVCVRVVVWVC